MVRKPVVRWVNRTEEYMKERGVRGVWMLHERSVWSGRSGNSSTMTTPSRRVPGGSKVLGLWIDILIGVWLDDWANGWLSDCLSDWLSRLSGWLANGVISDPQNDFLEIWLWKADYLETWFTYRFVCLRIWFAYWSTCWKVDFQADLMDWLIWELVIMLMCQKIDW